MKVLVIGSGGREHALVWKIEQSPLVDQIFCAPGNPGMENLAENISIGPMEFEKLIGFAIGKGIDLTVVGPEDPLVGGIVDEFKAYGLPVFGPDRNAARLEGSKSFSKELMRKYNIPTADYKIFQSPDLARKYLTENSNYPIVLKASGLAAGKGVLICQNEKESTDGVSLIMDDKAFGQAGDQMVVEEFLEGDEVSIFAICDGENYKLLSPSQDHKKALDGDLGKNTGGMGAYAPTPVATTDLIEQVKSSIIEPTLNAMKSEGAPYKGLLYFGIIITNNGPKVLEYNCRFGDPETEIVLPLLKSDLVPLMKASIEGKIMEYDIIFNDGYALDVVLASGGYPDEYKKGQVICGLDSLDEDILVFHAGTKSENGKLLTNGGRVLNIVACGNDLIELKEILYKNVERVTFQDIHYRRDIGYRAIRYLS